MFAAIRNNKASVFIWNALRIWLGWIWFNAGLEKLFDPNWMVTGDALKAFWSRALEVLPNGKPVIHYGWYHFFIKSMMENGYYTWFAKLVALGEFITGIGLILGVGTFIALATSAFMNLNFMLAGTSSSNPIMYSVAILLLIIGPAAYYYGADRFLTPYYQHIKDKKCILGYCFTKTGDKKVTENI